MTVPDKFSNKESGRPRPVRSQAVVTTGQLSLLFWLGSAYWIYQGLQALADYADYTVLGYFLVLGASLLPIFLWIRNPGLGMPIYPLFAAFTFITFGTPLITQQSWVIAYQPEDHLAVATLMFFGLMAGTLTWMLVVKNKPASPTHCRQLNQAGGERLLLLCLFINLLFVLNILFYFVPLKGGVFSLIQGVCLGLNNLSAFVLAQRMGHKKLSKGYIFFFITLLVAQTIIATTSLYLTTAFSVLLLALAGYAIGARRIPWAATSLMLLLVAFLHLGKSGMRTKYWDEAKHVPLYSLGDVIDFYLEWTEISSQNMFDHVRITDEDDEKSASLMERSSLVHLMLYMRDNNAKGMTSLNGETYALIPILLVPRILNPNKPWALEGNSRLNIHYGLQTREETLITTVGFGMWNEGYGNFGFIGVLGVGAFMGSFFGAVSRWTSGYAPLSFRTLFSILALSVALQTEYTSGVFFTVLFQGLAALSGFALVFMSHLPVSEEADFIVKAPLIKKGKTIGKTPEIATPDRPLP